MRHRLASSTEQRDNPNATNPASALADDVAVYLASRYYRLSHLFYLAYLFIGVAMVVLTIIHQQHELELERNLRNATAAVASALSEAVTAEMQAFEHVVFGLSLGASFVLSLQGYFNPRPRAPTSSTRPRPTSSRSRGSTARVSASSSSPTTPFRSAPRRSS